MEKTILNVKDKKVLSTDLTYGDLIILYEQYIKTYGEVPIFSKCTAKHNMPQPGIIKKILADNGIEYNDFLLKFGKVLYAMPEEDISNLANKIKESFPLEILGVSYYCTNVMVKRKGKNRYRYMVDIYDDFGYKYTIDYNRLKSAQKGNYEPAKFFKRNIYTYDNINTYCKINHIGLRIDGKNLPVVGYAREILDFVDNNGNIVKTSWNQISNHISDRKKANGEIIITNRVNMTKEKATKIILDMQKKLNRPLLQIDFENNKTTENSIGIHPIMDIWGNFTNMIQDLGLEGHDYFYKPNSKDYIPHDEVMKYIEEVCKIAKSENRNIIMRKDFKDIKMEKIINHCKKDNITIYDALNKYGCKLQEPGNGMNYLFKDGERTTSRYEYDFSMFLREKGFVYNKTYFRDVRYKNLDKDYNGNMSCDYCIDFGDKSIYVELAGILGNKEHQEAYLSNTPISKSKSKEEYRLKLNKKCNIFERNGLDYYILLPPDMNKEIYENILKKYMKEAA